jgi:type I restriction-modification system DNA methylase subunit
MFVQSAAFIEHHKKSVNEISLYGQEKVAETIRLCKMNLAVHGLSGDIRQANTYYEDIHKNTGVIKTNDSTVEHERVSLQFVSDGSIERAKGLELILVA